MLIDILKTAVYEHSEEVLMKIVRMELDELAMQDPSFAELAKKAKSAIIKIDEVINDESIKFKSDGEKVFRRFKEYIEILEHIAEAVTSRSNQTLVDCIAHLQEFVEINNGD